MENYVAELSLFTDKLPEQISIKNCTHFYSFSHFSAAAPSDESEKAELKFI